MLTRLNMSRSFSCQLLLPTVSESAVPSCQEDSRVAFDKELAIHFFRGSFLRGLARATPSSQLSLSVDKASNLWVKSAKGAFAKRASVLLAVWQYTFASANWGPVIRVITHLKTRCSHILALPTSSGSTFSKKMTPCEIEDSVWWSWSWPQLM